MNIESAMRSDGSCFMDHDVHRVLKARGFLCEGGEWFRCDVEDVRLLNVLFHTLWFLPNVAACDAMENLLNSANNRKPNAYGGYKVINAPKAACSFSRFTRFSIACRPRANYTGAATRWAISW